MSSNVKTIAAHIIKFVAALQTKKNRQEEGLFLVEGDKTVRELLASDFTIHSVYATKAWLHEYKNLIPENSEVYTVTDSQLKIMGTHDTPNGVLAVVHIPTVDDSCDSAHELCIAGDKLNDPGNLGSIIRIADWFGIKRILLSTDSVDAYNPKTVSAAKGSLFRTEIVYTDLATYFKNNNDLEIFGTFMDGESIYSADLPPNGIIVIGNEANGISTAVEECITKRITIPSFGKAESLNAAIATGIIISEFKRQNN